VDGSTGSLTLRLKSVGGVVTMLPQPSVLTEQRGGVGVTVAVGVGVIGGVGVGVGGWAPRTQ
jgi:hypothetical protein